MANKMTIDLQCGACAALVHLPEPAVGDSGKAKEKAPAAPQAPKFCSCCGAGFDRYCLKCRKRVDMFFEEWWPEDNECVRTYTPAKRCPTCNSGLEVETRESSRDDQKYNH